MFKRKPFPVLFFRDIIYFPMTWRFTNDAFGWNTAWDQVNGYRISACGSLSETAEQRNKEQLVQNNLINGGLLAVSGDWIYTNPSSSTPSLARWSIDGSSRMKLSDDNARSINVVDDWIYYTV
ncbi:hypothetical protein IJ22_25280 [Paenibacillus naphthalenovorans]|uniref:Prolow-density lipoprotein receptor-related protein 1-like beta-propeller domain-containing protein n=1 Tax=Paenibacillus naphthalenovorans TaxID=162209 RepID=A0A0U2W5W4_9BACL|nr:hypothetical protein IJ22_25280 [Paenibacillus naphthalenovorans]